MAWSFVLLWSVVHLAQPPSAGASGLTVGDLRCEYRVDPIGLDVAEPRLSWILHSGERGQKQTAYRVLAASTSEGLARDEGDLWDSGEVSSDETLHVVYAGAPLRSRMSVFWKVRVWDRAGRPSAWSLSAKWTMGLLRSEDWSAEWIADPDHRSPESPGGRASHNGYHSGIAASADDAKWVAIDLGREEPIDGVRLFPARPYDWQPDTPGFLFPVRYQVEAAQRADFADAVRVVDRTGEDQPNPGTEAPAIRFPSVAARYVRLTVTRLPLRDASNHAFALAEWQVLSGEENRAEGAAVTAQSSIELGGWASAHLTDGVVETVSPPGAAPPRPAAMFRREFERHGSIARATVHVTACGLYELWINGRRVGDQLLAPEWTSYRNRIQVQTYDVTELLRPGANAVAVSLAEGWYAGRLMAVGPNAYGAEPKLLMQLEIEGEGGRQTIVTDLSWRSTSEGPIRSAGIYDGETYDARHEFAGWDRAGFDDRSWNSVRVCDASPAHLVWQSNEPIRVVQERAAESVREPRPGVYVLDFGQNLVGWCRIRVRGIPGQAVTLRHGEMLNDDGTLYTANLRGAAQVDRYVPRDAEEATYEPRFTYHGFRYVELTGLAEPPTADSAVARVIRSTAAEVGKFACSDRSLERLMENILWSQRGNLMSSPNDCPQRDERFGWMGDIQAFSQTAIFNMDLAAFLTKFARDMRDDQADDGRFPDFAPHAGNPNEQFSGAPAWADAGVILPWRAYENYGDRRLLEEHFDAARRWVDFILRHNPDGIWSERRGNDYGDWLNADSIREEGQPLRGAEVPKELLATAFFAHSADLVSRMAERIGRPDEAAAYRELFERTRGAFQNRFLTADGRITGETQAGDVLALHFDLVPERLRGQVAAQLVEKIRRADGHLTTGIQTTHRAMLELTRGGYHDEAWRLLTDRSFPSWLYMIDQGATTIWERWDGYVAGRGFQNPGMNSFNHWAFGAVGEWMWRHIIGLAPDAAHPGWKHFQIAPRPGGGITSADGDYRSMRGTIASAWTIDDGVFTLRIRVPTNTTATVRVPCAAGGQVSEGGRLAAESEGVSWLGDEPGAALFRVESGSYEFRAPLPDTRR